MNRAPDVQLVLRDWLAEDGDIAPDRVLEVVADRIARQPQRARRLPWRPLVTNYTKLAAAVAAILVVGFAGWQLLPGNGGIGGRPTPVPTASPTPVASPSTAPSPRAEFPAWYPATADGSGILAAGSQTTQGFLAGTTLTVPDGWVNDGDDAQIYMLFPDTPANEAEYGLSKQTAQNILLAATVRNNMFAICDATGTFQGATAAEVIDAIVANEALSTTAPVDVTIGGLSGRQVDVQLSPDWTGSCRRNADDPPTKDYNDVRNRIIVLDTPDRRTIGIAIGSAHAADFEGFLADAMPIVESLEFNLEP